MSLRYKLIAGVGAVEGVLLLVLAWQTEFFFHRTVEQAMVGNARTTVALFSRACTDALATRDLRTLDANVRYISRGQDVVYAGVEDKRGIVLAHSDDQCVGHPGVAKDDLDFDKIDDGVYDISAPVWLGSRQVGTVRLGFSVEGVQELLARGRQRAILLSFVAVSLGVGLAWLMLGRVVQSILTLREGTLRIGQGNLEHRLVLNTRDEVQELAEAFNQMAQKLRDSYADLEQRVQERTHELIETQHELVQSEKLAALGQLSAGIAHELRNPMTVISASAHNISETLQRGGDNRADLEEELESIARNVQRAQRIISDVLEFARPAKRGSVLVDLNHVIHAVLSIVGKECSRQHIHIQTHLDGRPWAVCSPETIKEALLNVVVNAIQSMRDGGQLTITCCGREKEDSLVTVAVEDTGHGIPPEYLDRIFDPFFTTREPGEGTGLGLSIARSAIVADGGEIDVKSRVGEGTTVFIRLPTCVSEIPSEVSLITSSVPGGNHEIHSPNR